MHLHLLSSHVLLCQFHQWLHPAEQNKQTNKNNYSTVHRKDVYQILG